MAQMSLYDFLLIILGNIGYSIISISLLLFLTTCLEFSGRIKLLDKRERSSMRILALAFFFIGWVIIIFPQVISVEGYVKDENEKGLDGVLVIVGEANGITINGGHYILENVPLNASYISFELAGVTYRDDLRIPLWASFLGLIHNPYKMNIKNLKNDTFIIEGYVMNEQKDPMPAVNIYTFYDRINSTITDNDGHFSIKYAFFPGKYIEIFLASPGYYTQQYKIYSSYVNTSMKKIETTITYPTTGTIIDVYGSVHQYCGQIGEDPKPAIGAEIEMGGKSNFTNNEGYYIITNVKRKAAKDYNITLRNGLNFNCLINPSLDSENRNVLATKREIWLCPNRKQEC